jgi:hypothetical protein
MTDEPKPWERQPYDTQASWTYFQLYLEQDPPRSALAAYRKYRSQKGLNEAVVKHLPGSWRNMAVGKTNSGNPIPNAMTWEYRALAWDDHLATLERLKWVERRLSLKEKEWDVAQKLLERAQQMLMFPVVAQESADGKTIIMPAGWKFRDLPSVVAAASKLARLAADMSTENVSVDWREEARKAGIDDPDAIFRITVEQFERHLAGEDAEGSLPNGPTEPGENQ